MRILILLCVSLSAFGQYDHQSVFPDLENAELYNALRATYKPQTVLELSEARDTLYRRVHLHQDSVRCVYTGLSKFLDLNLDPSIALFEGGGNTDINLEHSYPQAKGAGAGNPRSDMHHLFPTRVPVNSARGNDPMAELPDNQTTAWYYKDQTRSNPPSNNKELWSEDNNMGFEPREDFKGNIARAYFYFYTMYKEEADMDDPDFFSAQQATLCVWHAMDPVDSLEWVRTFKIAEYQSGKVNPFVLDCRLARYYCGEVSADCTAVRTEEVNGTTSYIVPNVCSTGERLMMTNEQEVQGEVEIYNLSGLLISKTKKEALSAPLSPGIYLVRWTAGQQIRVERLVVQ